MDNYMAAGFNKVGHTAVWTAYLRSFSDIPFAKDLYDALLEAEYGSQSADLQKPTMAPQYEARYKILTKLLLKTEIDQVLELAAGFTGRGLALTRELPLQYVELEIPQVIEEKKRILNSMNTDETAGALNLVPGDALSPSDIEHAVAGFDSKKPVAVLNEGLMRYLTFPQKKILASNIRNILRRYGGVWITPDISLATLLKTEDKAISGHTAKLEGLTGKKVQNNLFDSVEHARRFFENLGFAVEQHSLLEVSNELVTPGKLGITPAEVKKMNESAAVFVMGVR